MRRLIIILILLVGCTQVTNFEECIAAGNPAMESYPRQCRHNDQTFVEVIEEPDELIGGTRDEFGCLRAYAYDEEIKACIRDRELDDSQKRAAKIAVQFFGDIKGLTIAEVVVARCPGCFFVTLDYYQEQIEIPIENWEVK